MQSSRWRIAQQLEWRWWKRYLRKRRKPEYLNWKKAYWHDFLNKLRNAVTLQPSDTIADIGCGPAGIFTILESHSVTALDPLLHKYDSSLLHFDKKDYPHVSFIAGALEAFEPKEAFDKVFCLNAINHVKDIELGLDKLAAATKPGGQLILSIDAHRWGFLKFLFRLMPWLDPLHPYQYNLKEYQQMLNNRGFELQASQRHKRELIFDYYMLVGKKA